MAAADTQRQMYRYKAVNNVSGRIVRGTVYAVDENDVSRQLGDANLELIQTKSMTVKKSFKDVLLPQKVNQRETIKVFIMLGRLLKTGVPILDSLRRVADNVNDATMKSIFMDISRDISEGSSLSQVMSKYPRVFSPSVVSIIQSSEHSGDLGVGCDSIVNHLKWVEELSTRVKKALRYPSVLMVALIAVVTVMMAFVVPSIVSFIAQMGTELPLATRSLIGTSEFFQSYWWGILGTGILTISTIILLRQISYDFKKLSDRILLRTPYFGPLIIKLNTVRYLQTFATLFGTGMPILQCLENANNNVQNVVLKESFIIAKEKIAGGEQMSVALAATGYASPTTIEMVSIGEESGRVEEVLVEVIRFYNADIDDDIDSVVGLIEPAITVVLGVMILWIAVGVFGPIYDSFKALNI